MTGPSEPQLERSILSNLATPTMGRPILFPTAVRVPRLRSMAFVPVLDPD
jgi:hypothetical protein